MSKGVVDRFAIWRRSALAFVTEMLLRNKEIDGKPVVPTSQQVELLKSISEFNRVSVRSGHGPGKSAAASWIIWWFLTCFKDAKVVTIAPTHRQLRDVLWSELNKWYRDSGIDGEFEIQKERIFVKDRRHAETWWCTAVSPGIGKSKESQADVAQGFHGENLLLVLDEASGIPENLYIPLEGAMTKPNNKMLLIGNPTRNSGYFYDTHFHPNISPRWRKLHWDSRDSENVTEEFIQYFRDKYGEDSNIFSVRIKGEPPLEEDNVVVPLQWSMNCVGNELSAPEDAPLYLGVDVARFGSDRSIILPRRGDLIYEWYPYDRLDTMALTHKVAEAALNEGAEGIAVDVIGVGAGVVDRLNEMKVKGVYGVNVAVLPRNPSRFSRLRDELWWTIREKCSKGLYSFPDKTIKVGNTDLHLGNELCNELAGPTYSFANKDQIKVESKVDMRNRGVPSPNIADALCLTETFADIAKLVWRNREKSTSSVRRKVEMPSRYRWMVV